MIHILHEDSENSITTQLLLFLKDYANSFVKNFDVRAFNGIVALRKHVIAFDFNAYNKQGGGLYVKHIIWKRDRKYEY